MDYDKKWNLYAKQYGYKDIKDMLDYLYNEEKKSLMEVAEVMESSVPTITKLMDRHGVARRKLNKVVISAHDLKTMSERDLCDKYKVSKATIWRRKQALK